MTAVLAQSPRTIFCEKKKEKEKRGALVEMFVSFSMGIGLTWDEPPNFMTRNMPGDKEVGATGRGSTIEMATPLA